MKKECSSAIAVLRSCLDSLSLPLSADIEAAVRHVGACQDCQGRLAFVKQALTIHEEDTITCQECQEQLPEYLEEQAHRNRVGWRPVVLHLAMCPYCARAYADLVDLRALAEGSQATMPVHYPTPRLPFRRPPPVTPGRALWRLNNLGRLVVALSAELLQSWQPPTLAAVGVKSGPRTNVVYQMTVSDETLGFTTTITIERVANQSDTCIASVQVLIPERDWPNLAGSEVALWWGDRLQAEQQTDAFGMTLFEGLKVTELPELWFEIAPIQ